VKSLLRRRPSPALIIALIALFVSLSGVSYGVATGFIDSREIKDNEVRSRDIRNNEIRTRDLRNNEVRGIDIRNSTVQSRDIALNAVTGDDVKEDTLAKVPSALLADSATTATTATSVSSLTFVPQTTISEGAQPVTLATHGPLTLLGRCSASGANTVAELQVRTTEDNSSVGGEAPGHPDVDAGQTANAAALFSDDPEFMGGLKAVNVYGSAPSGKAFSGVIALRVDAAGAGSCKFQGHLALQG
jgi:hypothetical protein